MRGSMPWCTAFSSSGCSSSDGSSASPGISSMSHATFSRLDSRSCSIARYSLQVMTSSSSGTSSRASRMKTRNRSARFSSVCSARRGSVRIRPEHGVERIEQEVRPDARLQRLQPRLGERRRIGAGAQPEVFVHGRRDHAAADSARATLQSQRLWRAAPAVLHRQRRERPGDGGGDQRRHRRAPRSIARCRCWPLVQLAGDAQARRARAAATARASARSTGAAARRRRGSGASAIAARPRHR